MRLAQALSRTLHHALPAPIPSMHSCTPATMHWQVPTHTSGSWPRGSRTSRRCSAAQQATHGMREERPSSSTPALLIFDARGDQPGSIGSPAFDPAAAAAGLQGWVRTFWMWKERRPQRRHSVCVLVWRRPKLPVPLPHLPMVRLYLRRRRHDQRSEQPARRQRKQRGPSPARAARRAPPLLPAARGARRHHAASSAGAASPGPGAGPPGRLGGCQAWQGAAWLPGGAGGRAGTTGSC